MHIILKKIIILMCIFLCNQNIFVMMISYTHNPLFYKRYTIFKKRSEEIFIKFILSACPCDNQKKMRKNFDTYRHERQQFREKNSFRYNNQQYTNKIKQLRSDMVEYLFLNDESVGGYYKRMYDNAQTSQLHKMHYEDNGHSFDTEAIIFTTIKEASKKNNVKLIDFLIDPIIVNSFKCYDPHNFWKEFLKDPKDYAYTFEKSNNIPLTQVQKEWLDVFTIENGKNIARLLIRYHYIKNIHPWMYVVPKVPDKNGCINDSAYSKSKSYCFMSPLHLACRINDSQMLNLLLEYKQQHPGVLDVNNVDGEGQTPINYAAQKDINLVNMLVNAGAHYDNEPILCRGFLHKTITRVNQLNFFEQLSKENQDNFIQWQLYSMFLVFQNDKIVDEYLRNNSKLHIDEEINRVVTLFSDNGAYLSENNAKRELFIDIIYRQFSQNKDSMMQLHVYFIFLKKISIISNICKISSQALKLYMRLQSFCPNKDIANTIMKRYWFVAGKLEQRIWELCVSEFDFEKTKKSWSKYYTQGSYPTEAKNEQERIQQKVIDVYKIIVSNFSW